MFVLVVLPGAGIGDWGGPEPACKLVLSYGQHWDSNCDLHGISHVRWGREEF